MTWTITFLCALVFATGTAVAQIVSSSAGAVNGTVIDSTKAVLPGVMGRISGPAMMGTASTTITETGSFRFVAVPPGEYTVTFELEGFGTVICEGIRVSVGFTATVSTEMSPSTVAMSLTVSGQSPVVDVTSTRVATRYDTE